MRLLRKALFPGRYLAVSHTKTAFLSRFEPFYVFLANQAAQMVFGFLDAHPYDASGAARLLSQYPDTRVI